MRWQTGSSLALLASSPVVQASRPRLYRRQDQSSGYNGTMLPQQLASSSGVDTTPVTLTYAFVPETHRSQASTLPTVSVISTYIVISTFSPSSAVHTDVDSVSTSPAAPLIASPNATNRPYPVSGSAGYVVPGNGTFSSASARQTNARSSPRPEAHNDTCGGATLNVLSAHLDYWYTETYTHTVSTVSLQFSPNETQTGWTLLPEASTFDITTAIASPTCTSSEGLNRAYNFTETYWDCFTTPPPVASSTTLITVDAFKSLNQTTGNGTNFPNLATEPPAAVATLPSAAGTFTEGTPFVYFSEFEIESSRPTTFPNGSEACATATQKFLLNRLFSFEYSDDDGELSQQQLAKEDTSGLLDPEFLRLAGITGSITPGTWTAEPTVIVVVEREVVAQAVLGAYRSGAPAGIEGPLMTPTPTLPSFLSSIKPTTATSPRTFYSPYIEQTAAALDVPTPEATTSFKPFFLFSRLRTFIAHIEHSETTLVLPQETDADVITTKIGNTPVTATAAPTQGSDAEPVMSTLQGDGEGLGDSSGQDEDEGNWIVRPFFAHVEESDVVLDIPAPETAKVVTAAFQGKTVTATAVKAAATGAGGSGSGGGKNNGGGSNGGSSNGGSSNNGGGSNGGSHTGGSSNNGGESNNGGGSGGNGGNMGNSDNNGNNGNGGGFAHIVSAIANAAKPSNAAQAMNQAGNQGHNDATAAAIAAGLGIAAGAGASENGGASGGVSNGGSGSGSESGSGSGFAAGSGSGSHGGSAGGSNNQPERLGASPGQIITVDNAAVTGQAAPAFVVGGQTVVPGGAPITVDGHVISAPASTNAIVVDGSTARFGGVVDSSTAFNVNGMAITAAPNVAFPIAGQTLQAGGPAITVDGTRLSLAPGGTALVIGSSTSRIAAAGAGVATDIPELTVGSQTFTANAATQFLLAPGQTLTPGGTAVVSGTTVSLAADGSNIVINGHTQTFASSPDATITPRAGIITVDGQSFAPNAGGTYLISGQTLTPGGSITVTGANGVETLSLSPQGSQLVAVVSGHTITSSLNGAAAAEATAAPVLTIGGKTFTALPGSDGTNPTYLIDGKVLTAGEEETVTVGGKTYVVSLAPEATLLEVEELGANGKPTKTSLQTLFPATATGKTSTMTGTRSSEGSGRESGSGTETGATAAPPAKETGAASGNGAQFASIFAVAGTLAFALLS